MRILVLSESVFPVAGNNALAFSPLLPILRERNLVHIAAAQVLRKKKGMDDLPTTWHDCEVHFPIVSLWESFLASVGAAFLPSCIGNKKAIFIMRRHVKRLQKKYRFDAIIGMFNHYESMDAALAVNAHRILYFMDPIGLFLGEAFPEKKTKYWKRLIAGQDCVLTTPFIEEKMKSFGMSENTTIIPVGFPKIVKNGKARKAARDDSIRLLFCGYLYSNIRSPQYFLEILSRLDERFTVTFMGRECEKLTERFDVRTKAKLITLPQQPYETALQALADADILINIGNSVPVHMPSKTLEYINTGKPFVNFYKLEDCPTLYYTRRYPLCLNLYEQAPDVDAVAERFVDFCVQNKGKTVDRAYIETEYADCTPEYIAQKILETLGE